MGQPVSRFEDPKLLRGRGRFTDDVNLPNQARGYVLRSPLPHARIKSIDVEAARAAPGVLLVLTAADCAERGLGTLEPRAPTQRRDGSDGFFCPQPLLAAERVRFVGDNIAFIVAETLAQAKDAAELVDVDLDPLPANVSTAAALEPGTPAVWDECPDNQAFQKSIGDKEKVDAVFAGAKHVVAHRIVINRIATNSMEPRACLAHYDAYEDRYHLRCTVQGPHQIRAILANQVFKLPMTKFHVFNDDVGGGFGMKGQCYPEYPLALWASEVLGRPVKWTGERSDALMSDEQTRDHVYEAELALDDDGRFLALRSRNLSNIGAYYTSDRSLIAAFNNIGGVAGTYTTPAIHIDVTGVLTNTMSTGPYRGAGRPEASYLIECMIDKAARHLNMDAAEIRRLNTIPADAMPFQTGLTFLYDCGDFVKNLDDCLELADYAGFPGRRQESRERGRLRGVGITNTIEMAAGKMMESAEVRFDSSGMVTLVMGTSNHGQGHETAFKQMASGMLGVDTDDIRFKDSDTDIAAAGTGTFGSRSATLGGSALKIASGKLIDKGRMIVAHLMDAAEDDISFDDGIFSIDGTNRTMSIQDVAKVSYQPQKLPPEIEPGFIEAGRFDPQVPNYPNGAHVCEVEIDPDTGVVDIVAYAVVDDVGTIVNPLLLKGQIHGGIAQGAGQALMEDLTMDAASGQLIAGSFMDYCMPRADDFCMFEIAGNVVPTKTNPLGIKGAGEAGTVGALAAVMNAVNDALATIGADYVDMPATPLKVWRAIKAANSKN